MHETRFTRQTTSQYVECKAKKKKQDEVENEEGKK